MDNYIVGLGRRKTGLSLGGIILKPKLYIFAISHYCEKARWALDHLGIEYDLKYVAPGIHRKIAKKLGAKGSSVPILTIGDEVLQGSSEIVDWAIKRSGKSLLREGFEEASEAIEARLDNVLGVHMRRMYYSEAMVNYPETVKPILTYGVPFWQKLIVLWKWNLIRGLMIKGFDLGAKQLEDSKSIIEVELDWLDILMGDGKGFLVGDTFSRADIALASLFAPIALPKEHPVYSNFILPPRLQDVANEWEGRPVFQKVKRLYSHYR